MSKRDWDAELESVAQRATEYAVARSEGYYNSNREQTVSRVEQWLLYMK